MGHVKVISATVQEFGGERYYLCGQYFQRKGKRLHRTVWESDHGNIPAGYHVHHKDGDKSNNNLENLVLMPAEEHLQGHMMTPERVKRSKETIKKAAEYAKAWHSTAEGALWHGQHAKEYWATAPMNTYTCTECGKSFQTKHVYKSGNRFCHQNCRARYGHRKRRAALCG